jgi:glycerol-3-phosphate acyltransferase PlsY
MIWAWLLIPATYLLASISFAYWAGKLNGIDLRSHGSGNLGATNAGRVLGIKWFLIVFACDVLKSLVPIIISWRLVAHGASPYLPIAVAIAALIGHSFTCFHRFKGGKGVATSLGLLIGLTWEVAALSLGAWMVAWLLARYVWRMGAAASVSPASLVSAVAVPATRFVTCAHPLAAKELPVTVFYVLIGILVMYRHRSNIRQLLGQSRDQAHAPVVADGHAEAKAP